MGLKMGKVGPNPGLCVAAGRKDADQSTAGNIPQGLLIYAQHLRGAVGGDGDDVREHSLEQPFRRGSEVFGREGCCSRHPAGSLDGSGGEELDLTAT